MSSNPFRDRDVLEENLLPEADENDEPPPIEPHFGGQLDRSYPGQRSTSVGVTGGTRLVIAIDYGTTFTGLAFAYTDSSEVNLRDIEVLQDWAPKMSNLQKVRSLISYTITSNGEAQWGTDISKNAITNVNTKLELELQPSLFDELDLTLNVLKGFGNLTFKHLRKAGADPSHTYKSPTEIVTDYLTKIYECMRNTIDVDTLEKTKTAVDIVVTVPVNWSYEANDATFKAIRGAGFNKENFPTLKDTILVSEPEAASHFTVRDLQASGTEFLKVDDCFVLCDAGGGTVDVVSFQVKKIDPYFELEKATDPESGKCGSAFIDTAFKAWLRDEIGVGEYEKLDPVNARQRLSAHTVESGPMRELIKEFEKKKKTFSNAKQDVKLTLPAPLDRLTIKGRVNEGELIILHHEMKKLINSCVSNIIKLIGKQIDQISNDKNRRTKNVFVVGGFGASPYLREELQISLDMKKKKMRRPDGDKSWTAIVQGGVIYGIEKSRHADANYMSATTKSYGIRIEGNFEWLIRKGDLVLSKEDRNIYSSWFSILRNDMKSYEMLIYVYLDDDGEDDVPGQWKDGQNDVRRVGVVKCDFSKYEDTALRASRMHGNSTLSSSRTSKIGPLRCQIRLSPTKLEAGVFLEKECLGSCDITVEVEPSHRSSMDSWNESDD